MHKLRVLITLVALSPLGCGDSGPKTYPVSGRVTLAGGSNKLAGHYVEAALVGEPNVRASGVIGPDGAFTLETLHEGKVLKGAREGKYQVRILPADEDDDGKKLKKPPIASKHLKFETSELTLQVPTDGEVALQLSPR